MSDRAQTPANDLDYPFLLVAHMVCADRQIHSEESKALRELALQIQAGQRSLEEMEKILAQDEHHMSVEAIAKRVPPGQQSEAIWQMLAMAYADGFCSALEREMAERVAQIWYWPEGEIQRRLEQAGAFTDTRFISDCNEQQKLSFAARLLKGAENVLSSALVDQLAEIASENVGRQVEQLRREILLAGPEYDEAIRQCAVIADEDYKFAEVRLKLAYSALSNLAQSIEFSLQNLKDRTSGQGQATTAKEVAERLDDTRKELTAKIITEMESVRESLRAKQRALNHFSIAFMGKTKAGKSTLHAILTDDGWDAIGVGKQRTTRLNRVYEWKNIRLIDTPGIGAPGGQSDEEIAQSVIEESDVICYVVTNDSIQETEFEFLRVLKEKGKSLTILLNVKHNLRDSQRLEHFLKNPAKLFAMDGPSGLGGHIERIRRYAKEYYANDYFDIIPVMLLAAQMSREPEHKALKEQLFKASRMQDFLDSIRESIVKHGTIRRSQTLLGSTVGAIDRPCKWVAQQAKIYQHLTEILKNKRKETQKNIKKSEEDATEYLLQQIEEIFQTAIDAIPAFAEEHWNSNEINMKLGWEKTLKSIHFEEGLRTAYLKSSKKFNQEAREAIEEIGKELELIVKLEEKRFSFTKQDATNFRYAVRIGGILLGIAAAFLAFFAPLVGMPVGIVAMVVGGIAQLFKSKDEKRREAVQNISTSLRTQLNDRRQKTIQQAKKEFAKNCNSVMQDINIYLENLIEGLEAIATDLERAKNKLEKGAYYLNKAYAKRIIDWCQEQYEPLSERCINSTIARVKRHFGREMKIFTKSKLQLKKTQNYIKIFLQEDVWIVFVKKVDK